MLPHALRIIGYCFKLNKYRLLYLNSRLFEYQRKHISLTINSLSNNIIINLLQELFRLSRTKLIGKH